MNEKLTPNDNGAMVRLARRLGRSFMGRGSVAFFVLVFFAGLSWYFWHQPEAASVVLAIGLAAFGFYYAEQALVPAATRARWKRNHEFLEDRPYYVWRGLLYLGTTALVMTLWKKPWDSLNWVEWFVPGVQIVIGAVCQIRCHLAVKKAFPAPSSTS